MREGVLDRLLTAETSLPQGLRLLFVEGCRPPSLQRRYFDEYAAKQRSTLIRHILSTALTDAGLINYPTEWWH
ncbi:MAG: hypothetical protein ABIQ18_08165 [Umezawaea sp.]